jgi:hypothetical protein
VICQRGNEGFAAVVDLADGESIWRVDENEPCWAEATSTDGQLVAMLDPGGLDGAASWLELRELDDGSLRHRVEFDEPGVRTGAPVFAGGFVVLQDEGDTTLVLVALDTGEVTATRLDGYPLAAPEGVIALLVLDGDFQMVDPDRQEVAVGPTPGKRR